MPLLQNVQHEAFADLVARGTTPTESYRIVYPNCKDSSIGKSACVLMGREDVLDRIEQIRLNVSTIAETKLTITKSWVLEKLRENVERAMQAIPVLDSMGNPTGKWKYEGMVACKALELIGKELGMFKEGQDPGRPIQIVILPGRPDSIETWAAQQLPPQQIPQNNP